MSNKIDGDNVVLTGEIRWAVVPPYSQPQKVFKPKKGQENNTHYSIEVECDRDFHDELLDNGLSSLATLKKDDETKKRYLRLKSPKINGKWTGPDPEVVDSKGNPITVPIANGSTAEVHAKFERWTYEGTNVVSLRFNKVVVTNLIEFVKEEGNPNEQAEAHAQDLNPSESW